MKRTHKFRTLGDVQAIVSAAPNLEAAAKQLGVNRSTLTRWMQQGKVHRPTSAPATGPVDVPATAEGWKEAVLKSHVLNDTDRALVDLADAALQLARDVKAEVAEQLSAMGRFAALVRQLNLDAKRIEAVKAPETPKPDPRRRGHDPRAILMAVK